MHILSKDIHDYVFHYEILMSVSMEKYYSWEVKEYGRASSHTTWLRHYWLNKLLQRQLKEFDRG